MNLLFAFRALSSLAGKRSDVERGPPGSDRERIRHGRMRWWYGVLTRLARPFLIGEEKGARTQIWAASETSLEKVTGKYFVAAREAASARRARPGGGAAVVGGEREDRGQPDDPVGTSSCSDSVVGSRHEDAPASCDG